HSAVNAYLAPSVWKIGPVADQPTRLDIFAPWIDCRQFVARRERHDFLALARKECIGMYNERAHLLATTHGECWGGILFGGGLNDKQLLAGFGSRLFRLLLLGLRPESLRIHENCEIGSRHELIGQIRAMGQPFTNANVNPGCVTVGALEIIHEPG